jgi:hypothetical protein
MTLQARLIVRVRTIHWRRVCVLPFIDPCIPREVRQPPKGEQCCERKLDGWLCQAVKVGPKVKHG